MKRHKVVKIAVMPIDANAWRKRRGSAKISEFNKRNDSPEIVEARDRSASLIGALPGPDAFPTDASGT